MIFYFTGTGNSLYIAKKMAETLGESMISIPQAMRNKEFEYTLSKEETVGFVYPVHACAPPDLVTAFIQKIKFTNYRDNYIYSVFNCAGTPEYTSRIFLETWKKKGCTARGFYQVLMPGNYVTVKKHLPEETCQRYLNEADSKIADICSLVAKKTCNYQKEKHSYLLSYLVHKLAVLEKNEAFTIGPECAHCGKCAAICPMQAITMQNGIPIRDAKQCAFCLACVNVCPTQALQVAKKTQGHPRYIHPDYNGKAGRV